MKMMMLAAMLGVSLYSNVTLYAQEKAKPEEKVNARKEMMPLRVQVVLAEYEGEKKVSSLPYTLVVNAEEGSRGPQAKIRMGLRVPINIGTATAGTAVNTQFVYQNVGTNLDSWASKTQDGRFDLHLSMERSSVYSPGAGQKLAGGNEVSSGQPVIQDFSSELDVLIRDGQTLQTTVATDPVSGRVTKAEVTVNVMK